MNPSHSRDLILANKGNYRTKGTPYSALNITSGEDLNRGTKELDDSTRIQ